jgi:site-specific DNA-methyltransferase (adenine-specific)
MSKLRAPRNRTLSLTETDRANLRGRLVSADELSADLMDKTILGDSLEVAKRLPRTFADLLFLDPPYNLTKRFGDTTFERRPVDEYAGWLGLALDVLLPIVKRTGTIYICGDWHTSNSIFIAASTRLKIRNRITWEREKGRGAKANWKNSSEDIWFCTVSDDYVFNVDAVSDCHLLHHNIQLLGCAARKGIPVQSEST